MEKFEFKSTVCTSREQSERLLALGLKKETADIGLAGDIPIAIKDWKIQDTTLIDSPAWSLYRLLEMLYEDSGECMIFFPNPYEEIIADIERVIKQGYFNKDYLEDKK